MLKEWLPRHPYLVAIALGIGFGIAITERFYFCHALGRPAAIDEPGAFLFSGLLTALPFLARSLREKPHFAPWLLGFVLSVSSSWWLFRKGVAYQQAPDGTAVDMAQAFPALLSPFLIMALCYMLNELLKRRSRYLLFSSRPLSSDMLQKLRRLSRPRQTEC